MEETKRARDGGAYLLHPLVQILKRLGQRTTSTASEW
jgi:hypothetical protein